MRDNAGRLNSIPPFQSQSLCFFCTSGRISFRSFLVLDRNRGDSVPHWIDCDRDAVRRRYDRLSRLIPLFDRLFFLPRDLRVRAVAALALKPGDTVLDIGCGPGINFPHLYKAIGRSGSIHAVDISPGMLNRAAGLCGANKWTNVELTECDAADYLAPAPVDAAIFSLSYNTMPNHRASLRNVWRQVRPGGRLVIADARLPRGEWGRRILPLSIWVMRHTMLGNPLIRPWEELAQLTSNLEMTDFRLGSYYIARIIKSPAANNLLFPTFSASANDAITAQKMNQN